jgi:hypothetical protein
MRRERDRVSQSPDAGLTRRWVLYGELRSNLTGPAPVKFVQLYVAAVSEDEPTHTPRAARGQRRLDSNPIMAPCSLVVFGSMQPRHETIQIFRLIGRG